MERLPIFHSSIEPQNKHVLWLKNKTIKQWLGDGWEPILGGGGSGITEIPEATNTILGGIKLGFKQVGKKYPLKLSEGKAYVEVPWESGGESSETYSVATKDTLGLVKIGYTTNSKNYAVELDSNNKMFVRVPWTDTNTTYNNATSTSNGLMSKEDKIKLDSFTSTAILKLTQEEYDALEAYDANILYVII